MKPLPCLSAKQCDKCTSCQQSLKCNYIIEIQGILVFTFMIIIIVFIVSFVIISIQALC